MHMVAIKKKEKGGNAKGRDVMTLKLLKNCRKLIMKQNK